MTMINECESQVCKATRALNVAFIVPPVVIEGEHPAERSSGCTRVVYPTPNIYELTVAAYVREQGHHVQYFDCVNSSITISQLLEQLCDVDTCLLWTVNLSIKNDIQVSALIHKVFPHMPVLFLGPGSTFYRKEVLCHTGNIVVRGEPEETVIELLQVLSHEYTSADLMQVLGLSFLDAEGVHHTGMRPLMSSLDHLPIAARDLTHVDYRNAKLKKTPYTTMVTSRNCPFKCIYCVPSSLTFAREIEFRENYHRKPTISFQSVEKVDQELHMLHDQGYKAIGFMDDNFIWTEERTLAICASLRKYDMVWGCQARVDAITEPIARALSESNCGYVDLGVESFNDEILRYIHKGITSQQIYDAVSILKRYHVPVKLNILIGTSPLETEETIRNTVRQAKRLKVDQLMINIVSPFPGTEFYDMALKNGWIDGGEYRPTDVQRNSILNYPHLSSRQMEQLLFRSNITYFLSPRFIFHHITKYRSLKEFYHSLKALKIKLFG